MLRETFAIPSIVDDTGADIEDTGYDYRPIAGAVPSGPVGPTGFGYRLSVGLDEADSILN